MNNQGLDTKRGTGIAILNLVGLCGPLLGTRVYPANDSPYYRLGMWVCAAFMLFNSLLAFGLRCLLVWENKQLDRKYGTPGVVAQQGGLGGLERVQTGEGLTEAGIGDENDGPRFRYIL